MDAKEVLSQGGSLKTFTDASEH